MSNDINLKRWKEYQNILTDSLWIIKRRDSSGAHSSKFWGNFIPQIPHQLITRYTKKDEWILDPFLGSGTTLIEAIRLSRNGIGIELNPDTAQIARNLISEDSLNLFSPKKNSKAIVLNDDSGKIDLSIIMKNNNISTFHFLIYHPPYWDIINFSDNQNDLSNAKSLDIFLEMFDNVFSNTIPYLQEKRNFAVVIGDKYHKGEWIPLGFYIMNLIQKKGHRLKSIIVKNIEETIGKKNQKNLWRYRALKGGFYIFKHEYILLFQKMDISGPDKN